MTGNNSIGTKEKNPFWCRYNAGKQIKSHLVICLIAVIKKMMQIMQVNWYLQTGISRQPLQLPLQ
jgi:hypothetical protein